MNSIAFSHKRHGALKLRCGYCHETAHTGERAGFPAVAKCMVCHQEVNKSDPAIQKLAALPKDARPFSARAYKVADFVFFSHARHREARIECETCHGQVFAQDALKPEIPTTMKACMECHKAKRATVACNACHEESF